MARASEDIKLVPNVGTKAVRILLPEEDFAYGNPNRPPTPMNAVMCKKRVLVEFYWIFFTGHDYGNTAAARTENIYKERIVEVKLIKRILRNNYIHRQCNKLDKDLNPPKPFNWTCNKIPKESKTWKMPNLTKRKICSN